MRQDGAHGTSTRVLVVEDEPAINDVVATALRYEGYSVTQLHDGSEGLSEALRAAYDLIVLDVMLPGLDGFEICRRMRDGGQMAPVLFLTARTEAEDRIRGFQTGGDDYVTKPFSVSELVLRVAAILRRAGASPSSDVLTVDDLVLDPAGHEVRRAGRLVELSATEFRLLRYLVENTGIVVSKAQILANVWDDDYDGTENIVELYVGYLRRKIDDGHPPLIHTKRGAGYVLRPDST
ncbi:MAG: response regulator transcription factor [Actinomycetota bacterium]